MTVVRTSGSWVTCTDSSGRTICYRTRTRPEQGAVLTLTGKVAEKSEFRGTRQTGLQAVKIKG